MSVDIVTPALSAPEARALTERIRITLRTGYDLITEAFEGQAWIALGYVSWDEYCAGEFCETRMVKIERDQRREIVGQMRSAGMSTRAIASGLGVSQRTVADDVKATEQDCSVDRPATVTSLDGRHRPASSPAANRHLEPEPLPRPDRTVELVEPDEDGNEAVVAAAPATPAPATRPTGRPAPATGTRGPLKRQLLEDWKPITYNNNRLERLVNDDRLKKNAFHLAHYLAEELGRSLQLTTSLLAAAGDELGTSEEARARWATDLFTAAEALQRLGQSLTKEH